jgi:hypothetical protein
MTAREKIAEAAQKAGCINKATEDHQKYWGIDEWRMGRKYIRIVFDRLGRVREVSWGTGRKNGVFPRKGAADLVLEVLNKWEEKK